MPEIAFSPCPNDTFIFHALLHGQVDTGALSFTSHIADVERLNEAAFSETFPVTKLSFHAYLHLMDRYELLDAGSALGYGCGPLLVAGRELPSIEDAAIAVPGRYTTAYLLLRLWQPACRNIRTVPFDRILPGIASGTFDAGVIIHEGRFVYPEYGCVEIIDLGAWWETETGLPIPLGCIATRKDPATLRNRSGIESALKRSIAYALEHPDASRDFVRSHAQELEEDVIREHIRLYVNDFTESLGETGRKAVAALEEMARCRGIFR